MGRALKEDRSAGDSQPENKKKKRSPIQIKLTEEQEIQLLRMIRADLSASIEDRDNKDWGVTSKGEELNFDNWFSGLKDLYNARRIPKTIPWKFCSNRSLRIATAILDTIHARILPNIINQELLNWRPGEEKDVPKVERISKFMNWWIWVNSSLSPFFSKWVKITSGIGDSLTESYWDVSKRDSGETVEEPIVDEMGNQLVNEDGSPAVNKFRRIKLEEKTGSRFYMKDKVFLQRNSKDINKETVILEDEILYKDLEDAESQGKMVNVTNLLKSKLMPDNESGQDKEKFKELNEVKLRNKLVKVYKAYLHFDADGDGFAEDVRVIVDLEHNIYLGGIAVKDITKSGKRPLNFTKFSDRFDRPDENDGEGVLEKVKELAEEIDAIFNQMTDANTLSILRPGFYDPSGDVDAPIMKLAPNRMLPVSDPSRNVFFPDISVNVQQLIAAIRLVSEFIQSLTATSAFVFGKEGEFAGGSGTATRTNTIVQSADTRFSVPAERLQKGASEIIRHHLDLVQLNIPPGLETRVLGEDGNPVFDANELTQEGISGQFDAFLQPDAALGSKQLKRDLMGMFYNLLLQNPLVASDAAKIYKITADLLKSWDIQPKGLLGPEPSTDDIDDPKEENTLIVQGDFQRVRAQIAENHMVHIQEHMALLQSPSLNQIPSEALKTQIMNFVQQHIQEHQQQMQLLISLSQKAAGGSGGGFPGGQTGDVETTKGAPNASGAEQADGPLGQALNAKRTGESGATPTS